MKKTMVSCWTIACALVVSAWGISPAAAQSFTSARASCAKKNVLFIMDRSGSMKENNKFDDARKIIDNTVSRYQSKVRFGLETFSSAPTINEPLPTDASTIRKTLRKVVNTGGTLMTKAVELAGKHLTQVLSKDAIKGRPTYVILVTDGKPNPPPCPVAQVKALRSLKVNGKTQDIKTYVVGFGSKVDVKCLNSLAVAGGTALPRANYKYILANNARELNDAMNEIVGRTASAETCNGKDDDCDGYIDNRKGTRRDYTLVQRCRGKCGAGTQICVRGRWGRCSVSSPRNEVCNGKDDDCNGRVDDGATCAKSYLSCHKGQCLKPCRGNECSKGFQCREGHCYKKPNNGGGNNGGGNNGGGNNGGGNNGNNNNSGGGNNGGGNGGGGHIACNTATTIPTQSVSFYLWMLLLLLPVGIRFKRRSR